MSRGDVESYSAFWDRSFCLKKCCLPYKVPVCDENNLDIGSFLARNEIYLSNNTVWNSFQKIIKYIKLLKLTAGEENRNQIESKLKNVTDAEWCLAELKKNLLLVHDYHQPHFIGLFVYYDNYTECMQDSISLTIKKQNNTIETLVPAKQACISTVKCVANYLGVGNQINKSKILECGYETLSCGLGAIVSWHLMYRQECYQLLVEKKDELPLLNNQKCDNLFETESKDSTIYYYLNNSLSKTHSQDCRHGTTVNEARNSEFEKCRLYIGYKSVQTSYIQSDRMDMHWNLKKIAYYSRNSHLIANIWPKTMLQTLKEFRTKYYEMECVNIAIKEKGYLKITNDYKLKIKPLIDSNILRDKLQPKKMRHWGAAQKTHLKNWFDTKGANWVFDESCKVELLTAFKWFV